MNDSYCKQHSKLSSTNLQNSSCICMRANATWELLAMTSNTGKTFERLTRHIRRCTCHKESPLSKLPTLNSQLLQIPHLTNRATPKRQHTLMQAHMVGIKSRRRPHLKSRRITNSRGEVAIVQPIPNGLFARESCKL